MYDFQTIFDSVKHLVGWSASADTNLPNGYLPNPVPADPWFDNPISGQYYNKIHPLTTLFNLYQTSYTSPNTLNETEFSDVLLDLNKRTLQSVLTKLTIKKKNALKARQLLEQGSIYTGMASPLAVSQNQGKFVGWLIKLTESEDINLMISRLGFQFNSPFTGLKIHLYHSSKKEAVTSFDLDYTNDFNIQWNDMDTTWKLRNTDDTLDNFGYYLLGYYQDDLEALGSQALNRITNNYSLHKPCYSCGDKTSFQRFQSFKKFFRLRAVSIASQFLNGDLLPEFGENYENIVKEDNKTFGMNADVSVKSDLTRFILQNKDMLVAPLQLEMSWQVIQSLANGQRTGSVASDTLEMARALVFDKENRVLSDLDNAINAFDCDMSGHNSPVMQEKRVGMRIGNI